MTLDLGVSDEILTALGDMQIAMAQRVEVPPLHPCVPLQERIADGAVVMSLDIQYVGEDAFVAVDISRWPDFAPLGIYQHQSRAGAPYVPQYFCFREGPPLAEAIRAAEAAHHCKAALLIVDGHGIAHPRRFGVASWLGVEMGVPSIGAAKETLIRYDASQYPKAKDRKRGDIVPLHHEGERVGAVLTTQTGINPVYVSSGHQVSEADAVAVILAMSPQYRIADGLRRADQSARAFAQAFINEKNKQEK